MNHQQDRQRRREALTADIIERVRKAIQEELAAQSVTNEEVDGIEKTVIEDTVLGLDALSSDEMQSEGALLSHIANARLDTTRLLRSSCRSSECTGVLSDHTV